MTDPHELFAQLPADTLAWQEPAPPPRWTGHPLRHKRRPRVMTYRVRLDLLDAKPPIWRRLDVASDLYLDDLHVVIQAAMGWSDSHLYAFAAGGRVFMPGSFQFLNEFDVAEGERGTPEAQVRLDEVQRGPGDRLWYTYDFGDGWEHVLKLESVLTRRAGDSAFRCVWGAGAPALRRTAGASPGMRTCSPTARIRRVSQTGWRSGPRSSGPLVTSIQRSSAWPRPTRRSMRFEPEGPSAQRREQ